MPTSPPTPRQLSLVILLSSTCYNKTMSVASENPTVEEHLPLESLSPTISSLQQKPGSTTLSLSSLLPGTYPSRSESRIPYDFADSSSDDVASPSSPANGTPASVKESPAPSSPGSPYVERSNPMGAGNAQTVSSKDPKAVAQAATDMKNVVRRKLTGYVGFANLPNQWHRKSVRKGFNFNVMVVGKFRPNGVRKRSQFRRKRRPSRPDSI